MSETDSARKARLRLWLGLLRTTRFVENALREEMRLAYGHTLPRFDVLSILERSQTGLHPFKSGPCVLGQVIAQ